MRELLSRIWKKDEGFSLIELIIVIAILAIIAAIAVPNLLGNIQRANETRDTSNAKLIADAIAMAIAQDPTLEGNTLGDTSGDGVADSGVLFTSSPTLGSSDDSTKSAKIISDAILNLNSNIPEVQANANNGGAGRLFVVQLDASGEIKVYHPTSAGAVSVAAADQLFPQ